MRITEIFESYNSYSDDNKIEIRKKFNSLVNMGPAALDTWLNKKESKSVGFKTKNSTESVEHKSGRRIIAIKEKPVDELTNNDYKHMNKVISYISRHMKQGPLKDKETSRWRYSLMNWGHDPLK